MPKSLVSPLRRQHPKVLLQRPWDDSVQNLDKHKLSPEQQLMKKLGRMSKHRLLSALSGILPFSTSTPVTQPSQSPVKSSGTTTLSLTPEKSVRHVSTASDSPIAAQTSTESPCGPSSNIPETTTSAAVKSSLFDDDCTTDLQHSDTQQVSLSHSDSAPKLLFEPAPFVSRLDPAYVEPASSAITSVLPTTTSQLTSVHVSNVDSVPVAYTVPVDEATSAKLQELQNQVDQLILKSDRDDVFRTHVLASMQNFNEQLKLMADQMDALTVENAQLKSRIKAMETSGPAPKLEQAIMTPASKQPVSQTKASTTIALSPVVATASRLIVPTPVRPAPQSDLSLTHQFESAGTEPSSTAEEFDAAADNWQSVSIHTAAHRASNSVVAHKSVTYSSDRNLSTPLGAAHRYEAEPEPNDARVMLFRTSPPPSYARVLEMAKASVAQVSESQEMMSDFDMHTESPVQQSFFLQEEAPPAAPASALAPALTSNNTPRSNILGRSFLPSRSVRKAPVAVESGFVKLSTPLSLSPQ